MKKIVFSIFLLACFSMNAQEFQAMVVYETKVNTSDIKMPNNKNITPEMQKMMEERMKKMSEKTFIMNFDKTGSIYEEEAKLETPGQGGGPGRMMMGFSGSGGKLYKNLKTKTYSHYKELMGKEFLIQDTLTNYQWKMTGETKKIGNYNCFKATSVRPINKSDFRNLRMKKENEEDKSEKKETSTNFSEQFEMPKTITISAWYTPEIPINQGPEGYWGLPGLILEISAGKTTILCTKVVLNSKDKVEIKAPTKGEVVSQTKYDEIAMKKMQEMQEMFRNQGGHGGGGFRMGR